MKINKNIKYKLAVYGLVTGLIWAPLEALAGRYDEARALQGSAAEFASSEDYESAIENLRKALELRPNHPGILYTIAAYKALAGDQLGAIASLNQFADMGLGAAPARNEVFDSLKGLADFVAVVARLDANLEARIGEGELFFELAEPEGLVEGIAFDPVSETIYLSSVSGRKVIAVDSAGQARDFITSRSFGLLGAMGMEVDADRRLLWITSAGEQLVPDLMAGDVGRSVILAVDLGSGAMRSKVASPADGGQYIFGDLALGPDGAVYVTNSAQPEVYEIQPGRKSLKLIAADEDFISLQGIVALNAETLIVADYAMGLFAIEIATGAVRAIEGPGENTVLGLDGLELWNGRLIAVQNGVAPQRVVEMTLDEGVTRVTSFRVLESRNPNFNEPTLGVTVGDDYLLVANSQWPLFLDTEVNASQLNNLLEPTRIVRISLKPGS